jgi:hypothetical protein
MTPRCTHTSATLGQVVLLCTVFLALQVRPAVAQTMLLSGGTMRVGSGTRIGVTGPIVWEIAPDAQLVNDGRIELGTQALLSEPDNAPITGSGTEHAVVDVAGVLGTVEPGGLGLSMTTTSILPATEVIRGHAVSLNNGTDESIARWFLLDPGPGPAVELELVLRYASPELNGNSGSTLALYTGTEMSGPWSFMAGSADAQGRTVGSTWQGPWGYLTAFTQGIITHAPEVGPQPGMSLWPTITNDLVTVAITGEAGTADVQVFDGAGRSVALTPAPQQDGTYLLHIGHLGAGLYVVRVNGMLAGRVIKE